MQIKDSHNFSELIELVHFLRSENGCPWDRAQTPESMRSNLIEESYEVIEAIRRDDSSSLCEELGDLLLQVVFLADMAAERKTFDLDDVITHLCHKLITRHSHLFGDDHAETAEESLATWEKNKAREEGEKTLREQFQSVPLAFPALKRSQKIQKRAAAWNFDWSEPDPVFDKVEEEMAELRAAYHSGVQEEMLEEGGDVLMSTANLLRHLKVDAELALHLANEKFIRRLSLMEELMEADGIQRGPFDSRLSEMYYERARSIEKKEKNKMPQIILPEEIKLEAIPERDFFPEGADVQIDQIVREELNRLAKVYGQRRELAPGEAVAAGDLVQLAMTSDHARFNRTVPVKLGRGLLSAELESQLIGRALGERETFHFSHEGDDVEAEVQILGATRHEDASIDDALIARAGQETDKLYSGLKTLAAFQETLREAHLGSFLHQQIMTAVFQQAVDLAAQGSGISPTDEEVEAYYEESRERLEAEVLAQGDDLLKTYQGWFGADVQSLKAAHEIFRRQARADLIRQQYATALARAEGREFTAEEYERELGDYSAESGLELAQLKEQFPLEIWQESKYQDYLASRLIPRLSKWARQLM